MTPFARKLHSNLLIKGKLPLVREKLENAVCFDMRAVEKLTLEVKKQMGIFSTGGEQFANVNKKIEHGGLVFSPASIFWIETNYATWLCFEDDRIGYEHETTLLVKATSIEGISPFNNEPQISDFSGAFRFDSNFFYVQAVKNDRERFEFPAIASLAAMLMVINAPYGIKRDTLPRHKGQLREAKRQGFELLPHHVITLDTKAPPKEYIGMGTNGSTKAFHFVRSHLRHYQTGLKTIVKAHWRGDPRLGIHRASYKVV